VTRYPDPTNLLNKLWGPKELRTIPHRLARLEHTRLIGREKEMEQLQKLLSTDYAAYLITVDGIGGVGKTALALDVAYQSWRASTGEMVAPHIPTFEAIIFVSAKQQYLTPHGILQSTQVHRTLRKIFQEVTVTLERHDIRAALPQDQADLVRQILGRQRTLLIVDNLETMEDKQEILTFLYQLPPTVKVVVTTRERSMFAPIRLEQLEEEAAQELIEQQAEEKQVKLHTGEAHMLYERIGGIPAALVYAVGQRADGYTLETVLRNIPSAEGDVARFCFQGSVEPLRDKPAHEMLMAFALFPQMPLRSAVTYVAGLETDPIAAEEALSQLQRLSLIREFQDRFRMLPLTREYALAELGRYPKFEQEARDRWINWYLRFTQRYGGHDMEEWHIGFDRLEREWENLLAVFDWCTSQELYDMIKAFWCAEEPGSVVDFTTIYGLWDDRLNWLSWLMSTAGARGDWLTDLDTLASHAYTLTLMGRYEDAEELFKRGQRLRPHVEPQIVARFLLNYGYLHIFQNRFDEVTPLLDQAMEFAQQVPEPLRTRLTVNTDYNRAASFYWRAQWKRERGDMGGWQDDVIVAREGFGAVMERGKDSGWRRISNYAQNYLADIAIQEGNYDQAEHLLEPGLTMAERNNERRRTSSYKRSFANLSWKQGKLDEALDWAQKARDGYERLGAKQEMQGMDEMIQDLKCSLAYLKQKQGKLDESIFWAKEARYGYERLGVQQEVKTMDKLIQELQMQIKN
jgi:LuxR family glucitol operon transcriptional activator